MKFRRKKPEPIELNLVSLIDVVFILLLFFVVSTTFSRETQVRIVLPESDTGVMAEPNQEQVIEIVIDSGGQFAVNGKSLMNNDIRLLMNAITKESAGNTNLPLMISADAKTPHQFVVTAMDAAGKLGFNQLRITTVEDASH